MIGHRLLTVASMLVLTSTAGRAQTLPPSCYQIPVVGRVATPPTNWYDNGEMMIRRLETNLRAIGESPATRASNGTIEDVRVIWDEDPALVEWSLAALIADDRYSDRTVANLASDIYFQLSGRASPVLEILLSSNVVSRQHEALAAIREAPEMTSQNAIMQLACDALFALLTVQADTAWAGRPGRIYSSEAADASLPNAYRLLSPQLRANIREATRKALPHLSDAGMNLLDEGKLPQ